MKKQENYRIKKKYKKQSKSNYLKHFNSKLYGELHNQQFIQKEIINYNASIKKFKQYFCKNCKELWINTSNNCIQCKLKPDKVNYFI